MSRPPWLARRKRSGAAGLMAGLLAGSLAGAVAGPHAPPARFGARVMHAAPTLAVPGTPVELSFAPICEPVTPACELAGATLNVRTAGAWTSIPGSVEGGEAMFVVPGELVAEDGFAYYVELVSASGASLTYPPSGSRHPIEVGSTTGFASVALPEDLSLVDLDPPVGTELFLPWGSGPGEVGRTGDRPGEDVLGPSSFDVGPSGEMFVADWVNGRIAVFGPTGYREVPLPARRTFDLSVLPDGRIALVGLGVGAPAYEVASDGRPTGPYRMDLGAPARVGAGPEGPAVMVAPGQWIPFGPVGASRQDLARRNSLDGTFSQELGEDRFAVSWTAPDGRPTGVVVSLPSGVRVGPAYFVHVLDDGGALVARGLWDDSRTAVAVLRLSGAGELVSVSLLPEPSTSMDARFSTVRFRPPNEVLVAYDRVDGIAIERFEVEP